jgi:hypothetical protein
MGDVTGDARPGCVRPSLSPIFFFFLLLLLLLRGTRRRERERHVGVGGAGCVSWLAEDRQAGLSELDLTQKNHNYMRHTKESCALSLFSLVLLGVFLSLYAVNRASSLPVAFFSPPFHPPSHLNSKASTFSTACSGSTAA